MHRWKYSHNINLQKCLEEQERLILLEQAARQKVAELVSIMNSEKSQGSVLKAIMHAKESNAIPGIYGRMGDLGAIDGEYFFTLCFNFFGVPSKKNSVINFEYAAFGYMIVCLSRKQMEHMK